MADSCRVSASTCIQMYWPYYSPRGTLREMQRLFLSGRYTRRRLGIPFAGTRQTWLSWVWRQSLRLWAERLLPSQEVALIRSDELPWQLPHLLQDNQWNYDQSDYERKAVRTARAGHQSGCPGRYCTPLNLIALDDFRERQVSKLLKCIDRYRSSNNIMCWYRPAAGMHLAASSRVKLPSTPLKTNSFPTTRFSCSQDETSPAYAAPRNIEDTSVNDRQYCLEDEEKHLLHNMHRSNYGLAYQVPKLMRGRSQWSSRLSAYLFHRNSEPASGSNVFWAAADGPGSVQGLALTEVWKVEGSKLASLAKPAAACSDRGCESEGYNVVRFLVPTDAFEPCHAWRALHKGVVRAGLHIALCVNRQSSFDMYPLASDESDNPLRSCTRSNLDNSNCPVVFSMGIGEVWAIVPDVCAFARSRTWWIVTHREKITEKAQGIEHWGRYIALQPHQESLPGRLWSSYNISACPVSCRESPFVKSMNCTPATESTAMLPASEPYTHVFLHGI